MSVFLTEWLHLSIRSRLLYLLQRHGSVIYFLMGYIKQIIVDCSSLFEAVTIFKQLLEAFDYFKGSLFVSSLQLRLFILLDRAHICFYHGKGGSHPFFDKYCKTFTGDFADMHCLNDSFWQCFKYFLKHCLAVLVPFQKCYNYSNRRFAAIYLFN